MLTIKCPDQEFFDQVSQQFFTVKGKTFHLEHSLRSIAKWEDKYEKPFMTDDHTDDEMIDYFTCMSIEPGFTRNLITDDVAKQISDYIARKHTATTIKSHGGSKAAPVQTAETLYAAMAMAGIPYEADKWNVNRLLMTIAVVAEKNSPPKKMGRNEILQQNADLNKARRAALHTKG